MAQVIAPEVWQEGIEDNKFLPSRYTTGLFTGNGVNIANNEQACRVYDMQISDYITNYDDRRLNGLLGVNSEARDGWGASAYGVFQDVRFDSKIYTMGRHRSVAMRIFDEKQYDGGIGNFGTATKSGAITTGQALMKTAEMLTKARKRWEQEVLGPDIDRYNIFAVLNGHISGRLVGKVVGGVDYNDVVFDGDPDHYEWIAQPGPTQAESIPPRFAPIHAIEWDADNLALMLSTIKTTWTNLFIPQDNRIILIDPFYEFQLLSALTGNGIPATDSAYADLQNGSFAKLMGWEFNFEIPSQYWPMLYLDSNLNVVHSANGQAAYDKFLNSIANDGSKNALMKQLIAAQRVGQMNYVRTEWDAQSGAFVKKVINYPLGNPTGAPMYGNAEVVGDATVYAGTGQTYPYTEPGAGYGLPVSKLTAPTGITKQQVIGLALYKPAAQLSQEYSEMITEEGKTRGKFTEMVYDIKYDAWVIESLSHGIMPIVDVVADTKTFAIPVEQVEND